MVARGVLVVPCICTTRQQTSMEGMASWGHKFLLGLALPLPTSTTRMAAAPLQCEYPVTVTLRRCGRTECSSHKASSVPALQSWAGESRQLQETSSWLWLPALLTEGEWSMCM